MRLRPSERGRVEPILKSYQGRSVLSGIRCTYSPAHGRQHSRVMWSDDAASDTSNTAHEYHSSPAVLLHFRQTQLSEEICRATVDAPRSLEVLDGDVLDRLHSRLTAGGPGIVDQNCCMAEMFHHFFTKPSNLFFSVHVSRQSAFKDNEDLMQRSVAQ